MEAKKKKNNNNAIINHGRYNHSLIYALKNGRSWKFIVHNVEMIFEFQNVTNFFPCRNTGHSHRQKVIISFCLCVSGIAKLKYVIILRMTSNSSLEWDESKGQFFPIVLNFYAKSRKLPRSNHNILCEFMEIAWNDWIESNSQLSLSTETLSLISFISSTWHFLCSQQFDCNQRKNGSGWKPLCGFRCLAYTIATRR